MKTIKTRLPALLLSLSLLAGCAGSSSKSQTEGSQSQEIPTSGVQSTQEEKGGVELNIMTTVGPSVVAAIAKNAQLYEEQTGNRVTISEIPQEDMFSKLAQAAATKSTDFDMFLAPSSWKASLSELGYVQVLDDYIERDKDDPDFDWNDVPHGMKIRNMWNGENYCITVDGDVLIMIYRRDVFEDEQWKQAFRQENDKELRVPQTMDELIEVCQFFKGKDWAGDGKPEEHFPFLTAVTKGGHSNYYANAFFADYAVCPTDADHPQGAMYFDTDMNVIINNPGYVKGLETMKYMVDNFMKPGLDTARGDVISQIVNGTSLISFDWDDTATSAYEEGSVVEGKLGYALVPGVQEWYDWKSGEWKKSDEIKFTPYQAYGGWALYITTTSEHKDEAWGFIKLIAGKKESSLDIYNPLSYFTPWRNSHAEDISRCSEFGWDPDDAQRRVDVNIQAQNHPNAVPELSLPGVERIQEIVDLRASEALSGQSTVQQALDLAAQDIQSVVDEYGRDNMMASYKAFLGIS